MEQPPGTQLPDQATLPEQPEPLAYPISVTGTLDEDLNRWVYRVVGYASLMTDGYPPFRLKE